MRSLIFTLFNKFCITYTVLLSLSALDFLVMTEGGFLDSIVDVAHDVADGVKDFAEDVENSWDKAENKDENTLENFDNKSKDDKEVTVDDTEVVFKYFNKESTAGEAFNIKEFDESKLIAWRKDTALKVITHGWKNSDQDDSVGFIKGEYLSNYDYNIITVDWSGPAKDDIFIKSALKGIGVGRIIARLLEALVNKSLVAWECVHCIGHGLGGQVMGVAGLNIGGRMGRISALDPSTLIFGEITRPDDRAIDPTDAVFVDIIHTAGGELQGSDLTCGKADFYPNGGTHTQPGCSNDDLRCSHNKAYEFYAESIKNAFAFIACQCDSAEKFYTGLCRDNPLVPMGDPTPTEAAGPFYLATNDAPPYGQGEAIKFF